MKAKSIGINVFLFVKLQKHLAIVKMAHIRSLSYLMLQDWCIKFDHLFSGALNDQ